MISYSDNLAPNLDQNRSRRRPSHLVPPHKRVRQILGADNVSEEGYYTMIIDGITSD